MMAMIINERNKRTRIPMINIHRYRFHKCFFLINDDEIIVEFIGRMFNNVETIEMIDNECM